MRASCAVRSASLSSSSSSEEDVLLLAASSSCVVVVVVVIVVSSFSSTAAAAAELEENPAPAVAIMVGSSSESRASPPSSRPTRTPAFIFFGRPRCRIRSAMIRRRDQSRRRRRPLGWSMRVLLLRAMSEYGAAAVAKAYWAAIARSSTNSFVLRHHLLVRSPPALRLLLSSHVVAVVCV